MEERRGEETYGKERWKEKRREESKVMITKMTDGTTNYINEAKRK